MAEGPGPDVGGPAGHSRGAGASSKRLALAAVKIGQRPPDDQRAFGYRRCGGELVEKSKES